MNMPAKQTVTLVVIAISALLLGVAAARYWQSDKQRENSTGGITSIGGNFTLQSAQGAVSLSDLNGQVVPLYFGYASCPDICPTSLQLLASAVKQLSERERRRIQPVFVSVDPERDSVEKLTAYANAFYPGMLGLTGEKSVIDQVTWQYRALYKIIPLETSAMGYTVDHSSTIYIIGKNGVLQSVAQHGTTLPELVAKLQAALAT